MIWNHTVNLITREIKKVVEDREDWTTKQIIIEASGDSVARESLHHSLYKSINWLLLFSHHSGGVLWLPFPLFLANVSIFQGMLTFSLIHYYML